MAAADELITVRPTYKVKASPKLVTILHAADTIHPPMATRVFVSILFFLALVPQSLIGGGVGATVLCTTANGHAALEIAHADCLLSPAEMTAVAATSGCTDTPLAAVDTSSTQVRVTMPLLLPCLLPYRLDAPARSLGGHHESEGFVPVSTALTALRTIHLLV